MTYSREPQNIDEINWYYEETKGIRIVHEVKDGYGQHIRTDHFLVPWKMISASIERHKKKKSSAWVTKNEAQAKKHM